MKFRKDLMLFSIVSVVFLAGCTNEPGGVSTAGVVISSFTPDIQLVDGGDVTFTVVVQNIGGRSATNVRALFFGLSNEWKDSTGQPFDSQNEQIGTLASADPTLGLKGEEGTADLEVQAPLGKSSDIVYDASVRVFYDYSTESDTIMRFVTSDYLRTNPNVIKGIQSSSSTDGPLVINAVARTPTVQSDSNALGRVQFEIINTGGGRIFRPGNNDLVLDELSSIEVTGLGSKGSCSGQSPGDKSTLTNVRLAGGKSKIISCDIDVSNVVNFADRAVKVVVKYSYFTDGATQVTVTKNIEGYTTPTITSGGSSGNQPPVAPVDLCGNGRCDAGEGPTGCPEDCS